MPQILGKPFLLKEEQMPQMFLFGCDSEASVVWLCGTAAGILSRRCSGRNCVLCLSSSFFCVASQVQVGGILGFLAHKFANIFYHFAQAPALQHCLCVFPFDLLFPLGFQPGFPFPFLLDTTYRTYIHTIWEQFRSLITKRISQQLGKPFCLKKNRCHEGFFWS